MQAVENLMNLPETPPRVKNGLNGIHLELNEEKKWHRGKLDFLGRLTIINFIILLQYQ